ncbi:ABC transporter ATP-binding protein [Geoalkalibacter halelectricus]|uniref:ATP-binding cassette domain-containing protein n=1 Tax=Geoalkalibacter halelectricus TaxID=2847045 RepID=A0ABY5ZHS6_9BACT|nr:ATP-binding cassette domain-containing protein [Geoalkalibacter halelectricus]MDO3380175.1 ATP-binding cassette domain-containing protein [Geoalkalibacter halelectricus]UWZ78251.1 ATP-binding cassette domain-containing protein [Geoalkalibacter halelectricus]
MSIPAIEIKGLCVRIGDQQIISNLDLSLEEGQKITLMGRSGSGKSTLLRCLLGFIWPEGGTIRIFGRELTPQSVWQLRAQLAYVAQEPEMGKGKVRTLLEQPFSFRANRNLRDNLHQVPALFERLHLASNLLDKDISHLSGGEKQRVALICALLLKRPILLLDEASSALDPRARDAVIELLRSRADLSVLSISHDQEWLGFSETTFDLGKAQERGAA